MAFKVPVVPQKSNGSFRVYQSHNASSTTLFEDTRRKPNGNVNENVIDLPRGGTIVKTPQGDIQFGIPPETIKDSMKLGITVPTYFVILGEMFDRQVGLNMAEFEFPAYFNFFCLKKKVTLICMKDMEQRIRSIFTETLMGPKPEHCMGEADHASTLNNSAYPNFREEGYYLDGMRRTLGVDTLVEFKTFNAKQEVILGDAGDDNSVMIKYEMGNKCYKVFKKKPSVEEEEEAAEGAGTAMILPMTSKRGIALQQERIEIAEIVEKFTYVTSASKKSTSPELFDPVPFRLPRFGITVLGSSHGFDPNGNTTGFVIWVNGRGIMVDPPPGSSHALEKLAIPPRFIEGIILTHCHADHDAGTFQKIMKEQRVNIYTTTTIFNSFMRKYSAISGFDSTFLNSLFTFKPVKIGEPTRFPDEENGALFRFYYSFHTIPTVGFDVHLGNESLVYSADTNSDPVVIEKMFAEGAIGQQRRDMLIDHSPLAGAHNLIFHEAGVPPIHTPMKLLEELDDSVKDRLFVVHVTGSQIPNDKGLKQANEWSTLEIDSAEALEQINDHLRLLESLSLLKDTFKLKNDDFKFLSEKSEKKSWEKDDIILEKGSPIENFYVYICGMAQEKDNEDRLNRTYITGDYTGENALVTGSGEGGEGSAPTAMYRIIASSKVQAVAIPISVLKSYLTDEQALTEITAVVAHQKDGTWSAVSQNLILSSFTNFQKKDFLNCLEEIPERYHEGDLIELHCSGVLVVEGEIQALFDPSSVEDQDLSTYRGKGTLDFIDATCEPGSFLCDVNSLLNERETPLTCEVITDCVIRRLPRGKMIEFLVKNPGLMVQLLDTRVLTTREVY